MQRFSVTPAPPELFNRFQDPTPHQRAVNVALIEQLVSALRCAYWRVDAVLVDQQLLRRGICRGRLSTTCPMHFMVRLDEWHDSN